MGFLQDLILRNKILVAPAINRLSGFPNRTALLPLKSEGLLQALPKSPKVFEECFQNSRSNFSRHGFRFI